MARILGLDLGSGSIGWAVINYSDKREELSIIDTGVREVPIEGDTLSKFDTGQATTVNADRTSMRTMRKMLNRRQDRIKALQRFLTRYGMLPGGDIDKLGLWALRAAAVERQLSASELGRVLLHITHKRGYNASKADLSSDDKAQQGYVADVRSRYAELHATGLTIGQYYYQQLLADPDYRIKERVLPRQAYIEEFDAIVACQRQYHPEALNDKNVAYLRDQILYYQRPLKSCKHLVSMCEFESRTIERDGKTMVVGPKVAHRSNPLFQASRLLQFVNGLSLTNMRNANEHYELSAAERSRVLEFMQRNDKLKASDLFSLLFNKKRSNIWRAPDNIGNGVPGDKTLLAITKALDGKYPTLLSFDIDIDERCDKTTGEYVRVVSPDVINQPLYRLWHTLYSVSDPETLKDVLRRNFEITDDTVLDSLAAIDFVKEGYGNMSEKAIKRILPYLMDGDVYSEACLKAGFRHSESLTAEENASRQLADELDTIKKGVMRQPVVEKILNQMVNVVNALIAKYGPFDEIHIELARELKMSRDERYKMTSDLRTNEKRNSDIAQRIADEYHLFPTKTRINKMKLWEESKHLCMYCGQPVSVAEFLNGYDVEVEHIIPKSLLFDDSFANKVCACRDCNKSKGNMTAYDFMATKGDAVLNEYTSRVSQMVTDKQISKTKGRNLLMPQSEIPTDFIDRQLRESQYIARKAKEMLQGVCRTIVSTSGGVTDYLRHIWGWDRVLHDINLERYAKGGLVEYAEDGQMRIRDWSKRCDHRHHAIDALTIACTTIAVIQRLNNLSSLRDEKFKPFDQQGAEHRERQNKLVQYVQSLPHFSFAEVCEAAEQLLVSLKQNLKTVSTGKRYVYQGGRRHCVQRGVVIPRGPLHEETIYGQIKRYDKNGQLRNEFVVRTKLTDITSEKDAESIVDKHIRELVIERLKSVKDKKKAFEQPLYSDKAQTQQIKSVRRIRNLSSAMVVRRDSDGRPIGFAKPGSNHHVAIYVDADGKMQEHIVTFKHAIDRSLNHLPMIITDPKAVWDNVLSGSNDYDQEFLAQLPSDDWRFLFSMRRSELFIIGLSRDEVAAAIARNDKSLLNKHLYKVQNLSSLYYCFNLNTQTKSTQSEYNKPDKRFIRIRNMNSLMMANPIKVKVDIIGNIALADD